MAFPLLQTPKTKEFFGGIKADPGHVLVYSDASSLEPTVMAYYSRDPGMLKLYQKGRPKNDPYILFGMSIPEYADKFRALGYDPDAPTKAAISAVKKEYGNIRDTILKSTFLGKQYGMGAGKLLEGLLLAGLKKKVVINGVEMEVPYDLDDAKFFSDSYDRAFPGIKRFGLALKDQWKRNGGSDSQGSWILGPRGEPITVPKPHRFWNEAKQKWDKVDYTKDLGNRFVQRAGHNIHMRMIYHLNRLRLDGGLHFTPFHIDWHDSLTIQALEDEADQAAEAVVEASNIIDKELGWDVNITYQPKVGKTMADFLGD